MARGIQSAPNSSQQSGHPVCSGQFPASGHLCGTGRMGAEGASTQRRQSSPEGWEASARGGSPPACPYCLAFQRDARQSEWEVPKLKCVWRWTYGRGESSTERHLPASAPLWLEGSTAEERGRPGVSLQRALPASASGGLSPGTDGQLLDGRLGGLTSGSAPQRCWAFLFMDAASYVQSESLKYSHDGVWAGVGAS